MADRASSSITVEAHPDDVMAVIADFEAYPEWSSQLKRVEVLERDFDGRALVVKFQLDAGIVRDEYTLAYDWTRAGEVSWTMVSGQVQKAQEGRYALEHTDGHTEVRYELMVDLAIPMLGLFKRKAEKAIIDTALKGLKSRVEGG